jgi:hypothetical protein
VERSRTYFGNDVDIPAAWEPDGDDFLSRSLVEADLMRRVLPAPEFARWFHAFMPDIGRGRPANLLEPAIVTDRGDPGLVHLDRLNLSRAWCMRAVAQALPEGDADRPVLLASAARHAQASLPYVASGDYLGEHWLASFAVYLLTEAGSGGHAATRADAPQRASSRSWRPRDVGPELDAARPPGELVARIVADLEER